MKDKQNQIGNNEVMGVVDSTVSKHLLLLRRNPKEAKNIVSKVILSAQVRIAARKARESVQRKTVLTGGGLRNRRLLRPRPERCELYLRGRLCRWYS